MNGAELFSINEKWHNKDHNIKIKVPPLGVTFIKLKEELKNNGENKEKKSIRTIDIKD